jgi:hypothetical protein
MTNRKIHLTEQLLGLYALFLILFALAGGLNFVIAIFLFLYPYICHRVALSAERKNRRYNTFFFLSLLISPLIMGIIVAVMATPKD